MFDAIQRAFTEYMVASRLLESCIREQRDLKRPEQPVQFCNQDEVDLFLQDDLNYVERQAQLEAEKDDISKKAYVARRALIEAIPVYGSWFKVEWLESEYGVCKYQETWGGSHSEVDYTLWSDERVQKRRPTPHYD